METINKFVLLFFLIGVSGCAAVGNAILAVGFTVETTINCTTKPFRNDLVLTLNLDSEGHKASFFRKDSPIGEGEITLTYECNYSKEDSLRLVAAVDNDINDYECSHAVIGKDLRNYAQEVTNLSPITAIWPDGSSETKYPQISLGRKLGLCETNFYGRLYFFQKDATQGKSVLFLNRAITNDGSRQKTAK